MATNERQVTGWTGWIFFAGFMMLIMGILQTIAGLAALLNDKYYVVGQDRLVAFDFTTWGWIHLATGIIVLMAGSALMSGHTWARFVAVILAMISIVVNFAFLSAYPIWSLIVIVIDVLIIYAVTVHGGELRD